MDSEIILRIIEDRKETDHVDFKRDFYKSLKESDLAKDISAFANTISNDDKYIVFGVDDKTYKVCGIDINTLPTQDDLDKYLSDSIEPFINVEIGTIVLQEDIIVGFIKVLADNVNRPYVIKHDCGKDNKIHQGDIFVRKGTVICKASRIDLMEMQKGHKNVLLRLRDDIICIEPINNADPIVKNPTYGHCDVEIYNESTDSLLLDRGEIIISTNSHMVKRRVVSILPKIVINDHPLSVPSGSRKVHTCLFDFLSQDCVDFGFNPNGFMEDDVDVELLLYDTDDNVYRSSIKRVTLLAKGDVLHKVRLKNKNVIKVAKRRPF